MKKLVTMTLAAAMALSLLSGCGGSSSSQSGSSETAGKETEAASEIPESEKQEESITGEDIGLSYADQGDVQKLLNDVSPYGWLFSYFHDTKFKLGKDSLQYNDKALQEDLSNLRAFNPAYELAPTDAKLVQGDGEFTIY